MELWPYFFLSCVSFFARRRLGGLAKRDEKHRKDKNVLGRHETKGKTNRTHRYAHHSIIDCIKLGGGWARTEGNLFAFLANKVPGVSMFLLLSCKMVPSGFVPATMMVVSELLDGSIRLCACDDDGRLMVPSGITPSPISGL